jgi:hypothetical protein
MRLRVGYIRWRFKEYCGRLLGKLTDPLKTTQATIVIIIIIIIIIIITVQFE